MKIKIILALFLLGAAPGLPALANQDGSGDTAAIVRDFRSNEESVHRRAYDRLLALGP